MDINMYAPINQLGYGIASLNILKALAINERVALWIIGGAEAHPAEHTLIKSCVANALHFNKNALALKVWHQWDMGLQPHSRFYSGLPIFELNKFNQFETHSLQSLDHIFVASQWAAKVLKDNKVVVPVSVAPFGVDTNIFYPTSPPAASNPTTFLNIGKWEVRKGHDILWQAFNKAFIVSDNVRLMMCCTNPFLTQEGNDEWVNLYKDSTLGNKIEFYPRLDTQLQVAELISEADCGVFPSRAEGWNLELLEMMACGKLVIATDYSAHTEFANSKNCYLVQTAGLTEAYDGIWFKGQGEWALLDDNSFEQLVQHMRSVHKLKQEGAPLLNQEGVKTAQQFSWSKTAEVITEVLTSA